MKDFIRKRLNEGLFDSIPEETWVNAYSNKINAKYDDLLIKGAKNRDYIFLLGNKIVSLGNCGDPNKCETNTFNFIKNKLLENETDYYPVGGFMFDGPNLWPTEHWWIYKKTENRFYEITPLAGEKPRCYAGIINFDIQEEIKNARNFYDVDFFKGGHVQSKYFK